jgi:hypothetical protein
MQSIIWMKRASPLVKPMFKIRLFQSAWLRVVEYRLGWIEVGSGFIACISASGMVMTPAVIFRGRSERLGENWLMDTREEDRYWMAATKKGWTSKEMGLKWLVEVFDPETHDLPNNCIQLLLMDGHSSHVTTSL